MSAIYATCASRIPDGAPDWIKLMPAGAIDAADGRKWRVADPAAVAAASDAAIDLVIDYEHQTDFSPKNGQPAPAAGWIKRIEGRPDGVWARVEWTDRARAHLAAKEYRYLSPTFEIDKKGDVRRIIRAALTNNPAIHDLPALAGAQTKGPQVMPPQVMDEEHLKALAAALGLPHAASADADGPAIIAAATALAAANAQNVGVIAATAAALELEGDARPEDIAAAVAALKDGNVATATARPDPSQFVSVAAFREQSAALKALQDDLAEKDAAGAVQKAMAAGKITPANKDWALALAKKDLASFKEFAGKAPVIVAPGAATGDAPRGVKTGEIAIAARAYQIEMAGKGVTVSTSDAVDHVMKGAK
ncbi:phage protease [Varunaivibrio sulfuroxidans]|uniref:Phage I-like protein n=1 Tax=Varunaivibrio sulfuroxidans TaxID=1773489 RepID=A0A4R3J9M8_9PROT|nr:phage protease [Varunaivibrio sulfuroxidans]TCS62578.1 phage I-like protein [Varunaivibrio sulfuroxidans]WES30753.1 phage protease [Varunaivibrio sulfuroxidans]